MIEFNYEGTEYHLEYNRKTVKIMDGWGFDYTQIQNKPSTMVSLLEYGAFLANHGNTKRDKIDDICRSLKNKDDFVAALLDMYAAVVNTFLENDEGNVEWSAK